jgi:hypothetical protein
LPGPIDDRHESLFIMGKGDSSHFFRRGALLIMGENRRDPGRPVVASSIGMRAALGGEFPASRRRFPMKKLLQTLAASFVALAVIVVAANADELFGVLTKVDADAKKVTVVEKDTDKEIIVTVTGDTEYVTKKGSSKIDLEKVSKNVEKAKEKGLKGINVQVTHEKGVASKIAPVFKKAAQQ